MKYLPLVEYYRRQSAPRAEAISLPGVGGGWRKIRGSLGDSYQQEGTGYILPAAVVERYLQVQRDSMLAGVLS